jgi:hypothetical protein
MTKPAENDSLIYATFISTAIKERNPWKQILAEIVYRVRHLIHFRRNMRASEERLAQLESQLQTVKNCMENPDRHTGNRINRLR